LIVFLGDTRQHEDADCNFRAVVRHDSDLCAARGEDAEGFDPQEVDPSRILPPPPAEGSENQRKELAEVRHLVQPRSEERFAHAKWDNEHEDPSAFAVTIGREFDLTKLPATAKLLDLVMNDQSIAASKAKEYFHPLTGQS
jgi:hypothetical protein